MATNVIMKTKLSTGEIVQVGDVGKSLVRQMPVDLSNSDLFEPYFFYGKTVDDSMMGYIGEINDIQIEPTANPTDENVNEGQTVVYASGDLL